MRTHRLAQGRGAGNRHAGEPATPSPKSHAKGSKLTVQAKHFTPTHFPFQPLPTPNGAVPFRFDLSHILHLDNMQKITQSGALAFHTVGNTGDKRGKEMDFVSAMMTEDHDQSPDGKVPAFPYRLGNANASPNTVDSFVIDLAKRTVTTS